MVGPTLVPEQPPAREDHGDAVLVGRGDGFVIAFTQDPNVRAYLDGLNVLFMNAIFRGSAHARPVR